MQNNVKKFNKKALEYVDRPKFEDQEINEFYEKFIFELYDNNLSKKLENINLQIHNTNRLIDEVYASANARNRDLISHLKATKQIDEYNEDTYQEVFQENKYLYLLKTDGYNASLKELFEDYSEVLIGITNPKRSLGILQTFYIEVQKLNREERKWRKNEKIISKEGKNGRSV